MTELPEGTPLIYANWIRTNATPFDVAIDFGYAAEPGPPDEVPARIVMSWEQAIAFVTLLNENIADYEQQAGKIRKLFTTEGENDGGGDDPKN